MRIYVGTSGWLYPWNKEGTLDWYLLNSRLNAIELNASFYRFPFPNQVKTWSKKGKGLNWVVKANRLITHVHILNKKAAATYEKFLELFKPLEKSITFYLFQMPPRFTARFKPYVADFVKSFDDRKIALEFRDKSWYDFDFSTLNFKGAIVTPDSPEFHGPVFDKNRFVYLRFHGRQSWYSYKYSNKELLEMIRKVKKLKPSKAFAFFNNDHSMLENARTFRRMAGPTQMEARAI